jgi:hypothetical protein
MTLSLPGTAAAMTQGPLLADRAPASGSFACLAQLFISLFSNGITNRFPQTTDISAILQVNTNTLRPQIHCHDPPG